MLLLVGMHSCSVPTYTAKVVEQDIPKSFAEDQVDSLTSADIDWSEYFTDSHLRDLIDTALVNNQELNITLQRIAMAQNEVMVREGEYLPTVNGVVGLESEKAAKYTRDGAIEEHVEFSNEEAFPSILNNIHVGLEASWELDVWGKLRNAKKVAVMEYLASVEGRNFVTTNLVSEIATSYYELISLDSQLDNLLQNIELQQNGLETVRLLQQAGRENSLAVKRFEAEIQKNQSEVFAIEQEKIEAENEINFLVGRMPQSIERSEVDFLSLVPVTVESGLPSQLLSHRPDIRQKELELAAAALNIEVARANFYPSFGLKAGLGIESFNPKYLLDPHSLVANAVGDMVAPLINRRGIKSAYANASSQQIQAVYEYEQTILNGYIEVVNEMSNITNLDSSYQLKDAQVNSLNESIEIANQLFQSARADYLEVLLAQREVLEAKLELVETKKEQLVATVSLYRALGGGW